MDGMDGMDPEKGPSQGKTSSLVLARRREKGEGNMESPKIRPYLPYLPYITATI